MSIAKNHVQQKKVYSIVVSFYQKSYYVIFIFYFQKFNQELLKQPSDFVIHKMSLHACRLIPVKIKPLPFKCVKKRCANMLNASFIQA